MSSPPEGTWGDCCIQVSKPLTQNNMGSSFWMRFRVWFPHGDPPREGFVTQAGELCLQARSYSFPPLWRGSTARVSLLQQVPLSPHCRKKVLEEHPYSDPLFCSTQTVPLLVTLEKGKIPSIKQFLPLAPKEHHTRDTGEKNSAKQHILAKTHQEFPIKDPFYLPLKRFNTFFRTLIPQNKTSPHTHQTVT